MSLPDFALPFVIEIDALGVGMGIVLSKQGHPIAFFNNFFCTKILQASTYICELVAIMVAV